MYCFFFFFALLPAVLERFFLVCVAPLGVHLQVVLAHLFLVLRNGHVLAVEHVVGDVPVAVRAVVFKRLRRNQ